MTQFIANLPAEVFEVIGIIGFALYVMNYTLLTVNWMTSQSTSYFVLNMLAASLVLIGLTHSFNLASALIQSFWIVISIVAIALRMRPKAQQDTRNIRPVTSSKLQSL